SGTDLSRVALLLSLSGSIQSAQLPLEINREVSIYEITLAEGTPRPSYLRMREELVRFKNVYEHALSSIRKDHPDVTAIHLFPAVPAPVAVLCGRELLPK